MLVRFAAAVWVSLAGLAGAPAMAGENLPIEAFAGHFEGTGIARDEVSKYFDETVRELAVTIVPEDGGFALSWSTVLRQGGDPDDPDVRENAHALFFEPTDRAHVFQGAVRREYRGEDGYGDGGQSHSYDPTAPVGEKNAAVIAKCDEGYGNQ